MKTIDISEYFHGQVDLSELIDKLIEQKQKLSKKDSNKDPYIEAYGYGDDGDSSVDINIYYNNLETDKEFNKRIVQMEAYDISSKQRDIRYLKQLVNKYTDTALEELIAIVKD